jgi:hypothetical protein
VIAGNGGRDPDTWANLAWCLLRRRHHEDAVDAYLQVLSADSDNPVASVDLALTLLCAGRTEVGLEELGRSMARVRAIAHPGRRKAVLREASRDLTVLAAQQMAERPDDVRRARTVITNPGSDDGGVRPSGLQVSPA